MNAPLQCLILAGGLGTRMRHRTGLHPKALMEIRGRPFLDWQLTLLREQGLKRVVVSAGFGGDEIAAYVGDGSRWKLSIQVVCEPMPLLGTAGALRFCIDQGKMDEAFFVLYGDSYLTVSFAEVHLAFNRSGAPALMTVFENEGRFDTSNVWYADHRIRLYTKTPSTEEKAKLHAIDYGLLAVRSNWIQTQVASGEKKDLSQILEPLSRRGELAGYLVEDRFYEVGSEPGLADFEKFLDSRKV